MPVSWFCGFKLHLVVNDRGELLTAGSRCAMSLIAYSVNLNTEAKQPSNVHECDTLKPCDKVIDGELVGNDAHGLNHEGAHCGQ
jgi:hypothetical protein